MEKLVYMLRTDADGDALRDSLLEKAVPALREAGARSLGVLVSDSDVSGGQASRIARLSPPCAAEVSFWMDNSDDREPYESILKSHAPAIDGFLTVESVPMISPARIERSGARTPGFTLVTGITRLGAVSYEDFLEIWYEDHKRVALETQSSFAYVRNTIVRPLTAGTPGWAGVVEESFPIEALTSPEAWYDSPDDPDRFKQNLGRMMESCQRFLDLALIDSHPMSEYLLPD